MMIKILSTILVALLLTACGSDNNSETKKPNTETPIDTTIANSMKEVTEKVATPTVETKQEKSISIKDTSEKLVKELFELTTFDGKTLHVDEAKDGIIFQEHKGKVVFLLFFGYRCPPCLGEIPILKALTDEKHKDLEIIAIEVQRLPSEHLKLFQKEKGINYTLLSGEEGANSQFISYIGQRAQWGGSIPFLVAINPKGEVKFVHVGGMGLKTFKMMYETLSKEK